MFVITKNKNNESIIVSLEDDTEKTKEPKNEFAIQGVMIKATGEITAKNLYSASVVCENQVNVLTNFDYFAVENAKIVQYPSKNKGVNQMIMAIFGMFVKELRGDYLVYREKDRPVITVDEVKVMLQRAREYPTLYRYLSYYCITKKPQAKHDLLCVIALEKNQATKKQIKTYEKIERRLSEGFCFYMMSYVGFQDFSGLPLGLPVCWFVMSIGVRTIRAVGPKETRLPAMVAISFHAQKLVEEKKWITWQWIPCDDKNYVKN